MKTINKLLSLLLVTATMVTLLVGCSNNGSEKVMEYNGYAVTEGMYRYWMKAWKDEYVNNYSDIADTVAFWTAENSAGGTNEEYVTSEINNRIRYYLIAQSLFDEYKLELTDEEKEEIQNDLNEQIEYYGSRSAYNEHLKETYGMDITMLERVYTFEARYLKLYDYLYSPSGKNSATADELDEYYQNNYHRVKYVVFYKEVRLAHDEDGNVKYEDLTEEEKAAVAETANNVFEAVKGGESIDEYIKEYMGDFYDFDSYPNGIYISPDEYTLHTAEVTEAAVEMEVGEVRLVEREDSYHVVQKFELIDKAYASGADKDQFSYLVKYCNSQKFAEHFSELAKGVTEHSEIMEKYKLRDL